MNVKKHKYIPQLFLSPLIALTALLTLRLTVFAAPPMVVDEVGVLSATEADALTAQLTEIGDAYDADIAVVVVQTLGGKDAMDYADDYFDDNGYGRGSNRSGALFLHCPSSRDYWISTRGETAYALSDDAIEELKNAVVPYLRADDFLGAYETYATGVDNYLHYMQEYDVSFSYQDVEAHPEDEQYLIAPQKTKLQRLMDLASGNAILAPIVGFVGSFFYMGAQKRKLTSVRRQTGAARYVSGAGSKLRISTDRLINRTVSKTPIARNEDRSSGGGRTGGHTTFHTSSSGASHGGGGGKY